VSPHEASYHHPQHGAAQAVRRGVI